MNALPSAHKGTAHSTALMNALVPLGKGEGEMGTAVGSCWEAFAMWWLFGDLGNKLDTGNLNYQSSGC